MKYYDYYDFDDEINIAVREYNTSKPDIKTLQEEISALKKENVELEKQKNIEMDAILKRKCERKIDENLQSIREKEEKIAKMREKIEAKIKIADEKLKKKLQEKDSKIVVSEANVKAIQGQLNQVKSEIDRIKTDPSYTEAMKQSMLPGLEARKSEYEKMLEEQLKTSETLAEEKKAIEELHFNLSYDNMDKFVEIWDRVTRETKNLSPASHETSETQDTPETPGTSDTPEPPGTSETDEKKPKTFEEILHKVEAAKNAMSDAELGRYESAEGNWLVPVEYDQGDWLRNSARFLLNKVIGSAINIPKKIYSMIRTGKKQKAKMQNITKNVNELSDQEFEVLLQGMQSYKGHENLVSASLRKAVLMRANREMKAENTQRNIDIYQSMTTIRDNYERSMEIKRKLEEENLSNDEKNQLTAEKASIDLASAQLVRNIEKLRDEGALAQGGSGIHGLEEENKAAKEGSNLRGRKFAKRYSSNEELEKRQAKLKKQEREARENDDYFSEVEAFVKHEELLSENTNTKNIMGITVSRGDRHHETGVFSKEYKPDDLAKNITAIATIAIATGNMIYNRSIVGDKNAEISQANLDNQAMAQNGETLRQQIVGNQNVIKEGIAGTNDTRTASAWAVGHEHAATASNYSGNWGQSALDQTFHQMMSGTVDDNTLKQFINNGLAEIKNYASNNPQYDYNALITSLTNLSNGGIDAIAKYNSAMQSLVQNAIKTGAISSTSVGAIDLSPTYISTMIPLVLAGKEATSKEYRRAEAKVKKLEEKAKRKEKGKDKKDHTNEGDER